MYNINTNNTIYNTKNIQSKYLVVNTNWYQYNRLTERFGSQHSKPTVEYDSATLGRTYGSMSIRDEVKVFPFGCCLEVVDVNEAS